MFVAFDPGVRVHLGVVTLGGPQRLASCLEALVAHESEHDFVVSLLVNPLTVAGEPAPDGVPAGVRVETAAANLGWAGGLHRLRAASDAELFVWVQDDMTPHPGWLDALVEAAGSHPRVGLFGSVGLDDLDRVVLHNGGRAVPTDRVAGWSSTDSTPESLPSDVTVFDWVTSKGCLTRVAAFDAVGGPDPRLWPLNRVDLDYSTHLRCHGWDVALVPAARLQHAGSQSAPSAFRTFLLEWRDHWFDQQWGRAVTQLDGRSSADVEHPCAEWQTLEADAVEVACGQSASRMVVPLARWHAARASDAATEGAEELALARAEVKNLEETVASLEERLRVGRRRRRRLRRRIARLESARVDRSGRPTSALARLVRRLRA